MNWEKASAIATVMTLVSSTFLGAYGVYLGQRSIAQVAKVESAKIQPLIEFTSRHGPVEEIVFENLGFGPAIIDEMLLGRRIGSSIFADLRYDAETSYGTIERFFEIQDHNRRYDMFDPALMGIHPPGAVYSPGDVGVILTIGDVFSRDTEWRTEFRPHFQALVNQTIACVRYHSIDHVAHEASFRSGCADLRETEQQ